MRRLWLLSGFLSIALLCGCAEQNSGIKWNEVEKIGSMELRYAHEFQVDYYENGYDLISIGDQQFLTIPEGEKIPANLPKEIVPVLLPVENLYMASSSAVDFFLQLDSLNRISMTSTNVDGWSLPEIVDALEEKSISYVGKYSAPDYEMILKNGCSLAIENTMIYHSPEVKEQLEKLGIHVLVERSSYETDPLGRVEWIRLYGILTGKEQEADAFFSESCEKVESKQNAMPTGKRVAFFYISSNGYANIRKPGDYVTKMIESAGGTYAFDDLEVEEKNALSTMNLQMENFYADAVDADILIYNSTIDGEIQSIDDLLAKSPLFADFKAVKEGNVWCMGKNMFQKTTATAMIIEELHDVITDNEATDTNMTYLKKVH